MSRRVRSLRHERIRALFDPRQGSGLEIGPLFDPVVHRADGDVCYVDVHPAEILREHYASHPGVPVDDIVDPDFVLIGPDGARTLPAAVGDSAPFQWVIASHVIEHVPDLLGWLAEVAAILADDGQLVLAVPDRRYSFDADRSPTTVGEMLLARERADRIPSVRAIYDHFSRAVTVNAAEAWAGRRPRSTDRIHGLDYVREQLRLAREDGVYVDCHVWLFTPQSFVEQLAELAAMDLVDFVIDAVVPTAPNELEFYAVLRRVPRMLDASTRRSTLGAGFMFEDLDGVEADGAPPPDGQVDALSAREQQLVRAKRATMARVRAVTGRWRD